MDKTKVSEEGKGGQAGRKKSQLLPFSPKSTIIKESAWKGARAAQEQPFGDELF